jgi:hypothetical protein
MPITASRAASAPRLPGSRFQGVPVKSMPVAFGPTVIVRVAGLKVVPLL